MHSYDHLIKDGIYSVTPTQINTRISVLKEGWEKFNIIHEAILIAVAVLTENDKRQIRLHSYFVDNLFVKTHEAYIETREKMTSLLDRGTDALPQSASSPCVSLSSLNFPTSFHHARLPRINLPKFDGTPADWLSFKDLFTSLVVDNPTLSAVEKLQYLKTSLIGTAEHLIKHTTLTADNFQRAWDALIEFYENKRLLVNSALHSLITLKRMTKESASEMEQLYTRIMQIYRTLEALKRPVNYWDDFFVFIAVQRLDMETVKAWEILVGPSKGPPSWKQFSEFLIARLLSLQAYEKSRGGKPSVPTPQRAIKAHYQGKSSQKDSGDAPSCTFCSLKHRTTRCPTYGSKTVQQRKNLIIKHHLCFNCLQPHRSSACRSTNRCLKCSRKHHTSIHGGNAQDTTANKPFAKPVTPASSTSTETSQAIPQVLHTLPEPESTRFSVLLATAVVLVVSPRGESSKARVLIDQGSEVSLITERLVQRLRLHRTTSTIPLVGIGQKSTTTNGHTSITLNSLTEPDFDLTIKAHILPKVTASLPTASIMRQSWNHMDGITLADPDFHKRGAIDMLLGADVYGHIIKEGLIKGPQGAPVAQSTRFGWILSGPTNSSTSGSCIHGLHASREDPLHALLRRFWELDEIPATNSSPLSIEEQQCETQFATDHSRNETGRYIIRLPFKQSPELLGSSKAKATRLIHKLSNSFVTDSDYANAYSDFIAEYARLQHMTLLPNDSQPETPTSYYLPHHGIWRKNSLTTKLRVVFNGSSRTTSGISLNDVLHVGAKLQVDLFDVLIWFRQFRYVFSSDVEKMFRQILVHPDDRRFQQILWIDHTQNLMTYQLNTVTYGLACAPFLALRTFQQLIQDEGSRFPLAVSPLNKGRYVDDIFGGADTLDTAQVTQLNQLCMAGGFELRKWIANHPSVLSSIPSEHRINTTSIRIDDDAYVPTLGLSWQPVSDHFHFTFDTPASSVLTKRSVMSTIAKLFDPLGLVSPIIITGKLIIQELWLLKLDWDDLLPDTASIKWNMFLESLQEMKSLAFPRWIGFTTDGIIELHGFCDASQRALAAVVYARSSKGPDDIKVNLLCSKTKVAPLKRMTIPRLELSAAVLLTKLVSHVLKVLELERPTVYLWTDSSITHVWINNNPSRWREFVHNRVCFIQETIPQAIWGFVPGADNPADLSTRGLTPSQLSTMSKWWNGPTWLHQSNSSWPKNPHAKIISTQLEERQSMTATLSVQHKEPWDLLYKYSSITRLCRITALCQRTVSRFRKLPSSSLDNPLSPDEIVKAQQFWIKTVQHAAFSREIHLLANEQTLPKSNALIRLTPFINREGLLRIGDRLQKSLLPDNSKHPMILPRVSPLSTLLIRDAHLKTLHGGTQLTLSYLRTHYWIIGGRVPIRTFILKCVKCARHRQQRAQQLMGQLPIERLTPSRPFHNAGVDYAGPFPIRTWRGRNARSYKAYIALFVCLSTSAVHLELVTDYTSEAFIAAYKRFTVRRGICASLTSDCGTNLKGADAELTKLFSAATHESNKLADLLANHGTRWKFIPPATPHFGGKWEAGVKSVKFHLKRVVGDAVLTYEEMTTFLTQVEAVLNSRPLAPLTDDSDDLAALTPGHFIMGCAPTVIPEPSLETIKTSHLSRWQLTRHMLDCFWSRWSRECLSRYYASSKWNRVSPSMAIGTLVLVIDEQYPPTKWPLGRVIDTHPGKDGHVRIVTVRTHLSTFKRPIVKLCPLPITQDTL